MDAPDIAAITKIVKMVGTEFKAMPDEDISFWIGLQAPVISQKKFGADYKPGRGASGVSCYENGRQWRQFSWNHCKHRATCQRI